MPDFRVEGLEGASPPPAARGRRGSSILNHPRDLHAGFRPFGPERHLALTGEDLDGWELPANAMEVVNSGAQQTDVMRPVPRLVRPAQPRRLRSPRSGRATRTT